MASYAFITGDANTKFEPLVFVNDGDNYEVICSSFNRQKEWYSYFRQNPQSSFEDLLSRFSYQNVEYGDVTPDVESMLNKLRSRFAVQQVAEDEVAQQQEEGKNPNMRYDNALLRISKRMRTGANER